MLKKYWIHIVIFITGMGIFWLIKSDTKSSIIENNKFAIDDTSLITKVFLADRNGNTISLTKNKESWTVNDKYAVRKDAIATLLSTAHKISIKKPVSKEAFENVVKFIATSGVYVSFLKVIK